MPRLFVGNFDFEHRLADPKWQQLPESVRRINEELATVWVAIADNGDHIQVPARVKHSFFEELAENGLPLVTPVSNSTSVLKDVELVPWGWTDEIRRWGKEQGWAIDAPPQTAVQTANSRSFSFQLEEEFGCGLAGTAAIRSLDELQNLLRQSPSISGEGDVCDEPKISSAQWVIKAEFSMSARERILGQGSQLSEQQANWVQKRLRNDGILFLEPWVCRVEEAGIQFTIPKVGPPVFEGLTPLLTDPNGAYRGNRFFLREEADQQDRWSPAIDLGFRAAEQLQVLGYFGPLGIDALRYRDQIGEICLRPLQDINARYTMGRLALGLRRLLELGEVGSWLHVRWSNENDVSPRQWFKKIQQQLPNNVRLIRTSPLEVEGRPTQHGTIAIFASSLDDLDHSERVILSTEV